MDFYVSLIKGMATAALLNWNEDFDVFRFDPVNGIRFDFASGVAPPKYQIKTVLWSFVGLFHQFTLRDYFGAASWITKLNPNVLGVGKVYYSLRSANTNASSGAAIGIGFNQSIDSAEVSVKSPNPSQLRLTLSFLRNGRVFEMKSVANVAVYSILSIAEYTATETAEIINTYQEDDDLTLALLPWSVGGADDWKWAMASETVKLMFDALSTAGPRGRWQECTGRVREGEYNVGRVLIRKGNIVPPDQLEDVWASMQAGAEDDQGGGIDVIDSDLTATLSNNESVQAL